ncbi:MAG: chitobiase/beta-hexosaminidase C-terminal domain-containing protein, partial [Bacteroides sp.]|nr:chitobiase/beta-hexosaminidase C-terminal domain-containing protein [Bacteroides sp.]
RYTLDGRNPEATSLKYEKPFVINDSVVIKAAVFREGKMMEPMLERSVGTEKEIINYFEYVEPQHWKDVNL